MAEPDGVFDAQPGEACSSLSFGAGLLDLPGPLVLMTGFEAGFGELVSCPSLAGELVISGWLELWDAAASLEVAFQSPCGGGSNKLAASLKGVDDLLNFLIPFYVNCLGETSFLGNPDFVLALLLLQNLVFQSCILGLKLLRFQLEMSLAFLVVHFLVRCYLVDVALHIFEMLPVLRLLLVTFPLEFPFGLRKFAFLLNRNCFVLLLFFLLLLMQLLNLMAMASALSAL